MTPQGDYEVNDLVVHQASGMEYRVADVSADGKKLWVADNSGNLIWVSRHLLRLKPRKKS